MYKTIRLSLKVGSIAALFLGIAGIALADEPLEKGAPSDEAGIVDRLRRFDERWTLRPAQQRLSHAPIDPTERSDEYTLVDFAKLMSNELRQLGWIQPNPLFRRWSFSLQYDWQGESLDPAISAQADWRDRLGLFRIQHRGDDGTRWSFLYLKEPVPPSAGVNLTEDEQLRFDLELSY